MKHNHIIIVSPTKLSSQTLLIRIFHCFFIKRFFCSLQYDVLLLSFLYTQKHIIHCVSLLDHIVAILLPLLLLLFITSSCIIYSRFFAGQKQKERKNNFRRIILVFLLFLVLSISRNRHNFFTFYQRRYILILHACSS